MRWSDWDLTGLVPCLRAFWRRALEQLDRASLVEPTRSNDHLDGVEDERGRGGHEPWWTDRTVVFGRQGDTDPGQDFGVARVREALDHETLPRR